MFSQIVVGRQLQGSPYQAVTGKIYRFHDN
jgi:hypothetical protein